MSKKRFDKAFAKFIGQGEEKITPPTFFQVLAEIERERAHKTIDLQAAIVDGSCALPLRRSFPSARTKSGWAINASSCMLPPAIEASVLFCNISSSHLLGCNSSASQNAPRLRRSRSSLLRQSPGKEMALLPSPPLRTVRASFPAHGSSISNALR